MLNINSGDIVRLFLLRTKEKLVGHRERNLAVFKPISKRLKQISYTRPYSDFISVLFVRNGYKWFYATWKQYQMYGCRWSSVCMSCYAHDVWSTTETSHTKIITTVLKCVSDWVKHDCTHCKLDKSVFHVKNACFTRDSATLLQIRWFVCQELVRRREA